MGIFAETSVLHNAAWRETLALVRRMTKLDPGMAQCGLTDEPRYRVQYSEGRIRVWRHRGGRMLPTCIRYLHKSPVLGVIDWGAIGTFMVHNMHISSSVI